MTDGTIAALVGSIVIFLGACALALLTSPFGNRKTKSEMKQEFKRNIKRLEEMRGIISAKLDMYYETAKLKKLVTDHPELRKDVEEYIAFRNEVFGVNYTLNNIEPITGKGDNKNE